MRINYIIATYFGKRRSYHDTEDKFIFLKEQIKFFESIPEDSPIDNIVFSINDDGSVPRKKIEEKIYSSKIQKSFDILYRKNVGYSYANWNENLIRYKDAGFDYHFLMEDDYIPTSPYFYIPFLNLMGEKIPFVCLLASESGFMGHQRHPTMSVGMMRNKEAKEIFEAKNNVLFVHPGQDYSSAEESQIHMMDYFNEMGYDFVGISDNIRKPFWDNSLGLWERGGTDNPLIIPIGVDLT